SPEQSRTADPCIISVVLYPAELRDSVFYFFFFEPTDKRTRSSETISRKEVFQPHLPVRLPCYDLALVTGFTLGSSLRSPTSGTPSFHGLTGGVYKARERIHRIMADIRLLAIPASRSRVADSDPNCDRFYRFAPIRIVAALCTGHCSTCVAQDVRAVMI